MTNGLHVWSQAERSAYLNAWEIGSCPSFFVYFLMNRNEEKYLAGDSESLSCKCCWKQVHLWKNAFRCCTEPLFRAMLSVWKS